MKCHCTENKVSRNLSFPTPGHYTYCIFGSIITKQRNRRSRIHRFISFLLLLLLLLFFVAIAIVIVISIAIVIVII
jgi:hypothetical protein